MLFFITLKETVKEEIAKVNEKTSIDQHSKLLTQYIHLIEKDEDVDFISQYLDKE